MWLLLFCCYGREVDSDKNRHPLPPKETAAYLCGCYFFELIDDIVRIYYLHKFYKAIDNSILS